MSAIVTGIVQGGVYALFSLSLALVFSVMRLVNFSHGDLLTLALYGIVAISGLGLAVPVAVAAVIVGMAGVGLILYRVVFAPSFRAPDPGLAQVFATVAVSIVIQNSLLSGFGADTHTVAQPDWGSVQLLGTSIPVQRLIPLAVLVLVSLVLGLGLSRTRFGITVRAVAEARDNATLSGINVRRVYAIVSAGACALVGVAAGALAPIYIVYPTTGFNLLLIAFMAVVIGGLGSVSGAVAGGLLLGVVESVSGFYLGTIWAPAFMYAVFLLVLLFRPNGLVGDPSWKLA